MRECAVENLPASSKEGTALGTPSPHPPLTIRFQGTSLVSTLWTSMIGGL